MVNGHNSLRASLDLGVHQEVAPVPVRVAEPQVEARHLSERSNNNP